MQIHQYHPDTGEHLHSGPARLDPKELEQGVERALVPANATLVAPPEALEGLARVFDGQAWTQVKDHRGETVWRKADANAVVVDRLGPIGPDCTDQEPCAFPVWDEQTETWTLDTAAQTATREAAILAELVGLDAATVRPLRAVLAAEKAGGSPDPEDIARLSSLEAQAVALRLELAGLE